MHIYIYIFTNKCFSIHINSYIFFSIHLKISSLFCLCVCPVSLKMRIRNVGANNVNIIQKCIITDHRRLYFEQTRSNPIEPAMT